MTFSIGRGFAELQILKKMKMALSVELWRILWCNFAYTLILTRCSQWDCQMLFGIDRGFAEVQILKKVKLPYPLNLLVYFNKILHTHYYWHDLDKGIVKSSPRDCKMTFNIGRGCAALQILKKGKWPNWVDYCDETLHVHWYCHMSFGIGRGVAEVQILINNETCPISWNILNILIKLCLNIATDVS